MGFWMLYGCFGDKPKSFPSLSRIIKQVGIFMQLYFLRQAGVCASSLGSLIQLFPTH